MSLPCLKASSYEVSRLLSLSSRNLWLVQHSAGPDLRRVIGHTSVLANMESIDYNSYQSTFATHSSYRRRVSKPLGTPFDDEEECEDVEDNMDRSWSSRREEANSRYLSGVKPPSSAHLISYENLSYSSPPLTSGQVRAIDISVTEVEVAEDIDAEGC